MRYCNFLSKSKIGVTLIVIFAVFLHLVGCKSQKIDTKMTTKTETTRQSVESLQLKEKSFEFSEFQDLKSENFNISLKSTNDKPAKVVEYRQGKPYRSIVVENAEYSESKEDKQVIKENFTTEINTLKSKVITQKEQINELKTKVEKVEIDNMQLSKNFKYLLYFLILLSIIWICERTGLFRVVKKLLNGL